ncbi:aldolase [Rhodoblastus acidophilus]|uniref:Aldolase n=1 Tax=Candidatus Rhodoblastus alkanivorans TaxID=2954117 RepID=A0ABS9Z838_9HYPH|nr:aldolase/citrate lyase family protein [Candidatus Rhodoblastus alkanivorans]MCI4677917.1 aldolase [Candidatus Rhodoblastus alkanivorans]MCI4683813.1 aldolase [Candidatus Rhodoblastus alkanivorans]MDI4641131.1 aldolase [Rhodoblastus acidophilus]
MRSILVVPAASPSFAAALASEADAFAIDLAVPGDAQAARRAATEMLAAAKAAGKIRLAMIHPLATGLADADLDAVMTAAPDGIVLPDATGGRDVQHLGAKLAVREAENDLADGSTRILALAADSPAAIFELGSLARAARRLIGIGRDERRLCERLGLAWPLVGDEPEPLRVARGLVVLAAAAAGAPAFDSAEPGEGEAYARACARAARDGFSGKFALTPDQALRINAAFAGVRRS